MNSNKHTVSESGHTWALVLAAGEGSRLKSLTTTLSGLAIPKQFCSLNGGPSLLQEALHRAEAVAPRNRVCAVVAEQHRRWWEGPLWSLPESNVIVQPDNRGTALGILLPLLHIEARDPDARVVLLPSDHHVNDEAALARSLRSAAGQATRRRDEIFILGVEPEEADTELGYIVPARSDLRGGFHVSQFVEKPSHTLARQLLDQGALWNVFILAGSVHSFLRLFERRYPEMVMEMRGILHHTLQIADQDIATIDLYERLPTLDFSRDVLEGQEHVLRMLPVPQCGWSDLGTPKRVAETLRRIPQDIDTSPFSASAFLNLAAQHARLQIAG
jgi:mannose-1-phosphate guanylyltransferase